MVRFTLLLFVILLSARASIQLSTQIDLAALELTILAGIFPLFPLLARFFAASLLLIGLGLDSALLLSLFRSTFYYIIIYYNG